MHQMSFFNHCERNAQKYLQHPNLCALLLHDGGDHGGLVVRRGRLATPLVRLASVRVLGCARARELDCGQDIKSLNKQEEKQG